MFSKPKNSHIEKRLAISFILILIVSLFVGIHSIIESNRIWKDTELLYEHPFTISKTVRDIKSNIIAMHRCMKDVTLAVNEEEILEANKKVKELEAENLEYFDIVFNSFLGNPKDVQQAYEAFINWQNIRKEVIELKLNGKIKKASWIIQNKCTNHIELLMNRIQSMIDFANNKGQEFYLRAKSSRDKSIRFQLTLIFISTAVIFLILIYLLSQIKKQKKTRNALQESERKLSTLLSNLPGIAYRCLNDEHWTMTFVSKGCKDLTGYEQEDLLHNKTISFGELIHPNDRKDVETHIRDKINQEKAFKIQYRIIKKTGEICWVWEQGVGIKNDQGKIEYLEGFITDITERKNADNALKESEEKHRIFLENSLEGLYILKNKKVFFCNNKFANIFGYHKADDVIGINMFDFVHPDSMELVKEKIRLREKGIEKVTHYEFYGKKKDGSKVLLETLGSLIYIKGKSAIQGSLRDISKQHQSAEMIRKLSRSVEQSPNSVMITNLQGKIEYVNPKFVELTGYTFDDVNGQNASIVKSGATPNEVYKNMWETITNGKDWKGELLNKKKNGESYWELVIISPIKDQYGIITHFLGIKEDITERKKIEDELLKAKTKAEESDKLKTSFLANMSHEIRTPMNAIMGFSNLLADPNLSKEDRDEFIELINNNSNNLINLIDDIIDIAKIEAGQLKISEEQFSLTGILKELNSTYQEINIKKNNGAVKLIWDKDENAPIDLIISDSHRIKQVLSNLIGNAIKYTKKGSIHFGYKIIDNINKDGGKKIQFYVRDTGIGIPKEQMGIIFDRFRQADESHTRVFGGTGLGLAISQNIAHLLNGRINAVSTLEKGSVFYFTIPLNIPQIKEEPEKQYKIKLEEINWSDKTVLIAEDVESNFQLLKTYLKRSGIKVIWAQNGKVALDEIKSGKVIDIILMDMQMPVMNGFDATKKLKAINKNLPILGVTAFALQGDKQKVLDAGCDDYISKPVKAVEIYTKMSNFIN